jgi:hypothetical protein
MAVVEVKELNAGRGGKEAYQPDGTTVFTRTRSWRVETGAAANDDVTVLASALLPKIGTAHPNHANCKCSSREAKPESAGQKLHWIVTAEYSTKWDIAENPLDDPAITEWSTETYQTIVERDIDGNGIINSAGDPFDPPAEKDDSRWTSVTRKNVATNVPDWMFAYQDAVNSDSYTIDSITITAGWAKVSAIHLSEIQERNAIQYRVITVTIHYRAENEGIGSGSGSYGSGSGTDEIEPWHLSLLDAGFREVQLSGSGSASGSGTCDGELVKIKDCDGDEVTSPAMLDGEGTKIDNPTPEDAVFLQFQVYREKAFQLIEAIFT